MPIRRPVVLGLVLSVAACAESENFLLREKSAKKDEGVQLEYWSTREAFLAAAQGVKRKAAAAG